MMDSHNSPLVNTLKKMFLPFFLHRTPEQRLVYLFLKFAPSHMLQLWKLIPGAGEVGRHDTSHFILVKENMGSNTTFPYMRGADS